LIRSIRYAIERHAMSMALRSLSLVDDLTGLYNRRGFLTLAEQQLKTAERLQQKMILMFADLDGLKWINDNLGHGEGDLALKAAATVFKKTFRESDIVARLGGDEFLVLVLAAGGENAETVVKRLTDNLDAFNYGNNRAYKISMSMGFAHYDPATPCNLEDLLERADRLMYQRKREKNSH
jgi:diguanylate cyclase (GGDEF)-like protein